MSVVPEHKIDEEIKKTHKPIVYSGQPLPFNDLTDRNFEILLYYIFKERLLRKDDEVISMCDNVNLMQGVGEQGRDITLSREGAFSAIIQCKKHKNNLSSHDVGLEVLKFAMNYMNETSLIGDINNFKYFFSVSTGFTGKTIGNFNDFGYYLCNEPELEQWFNKIVKTYPAKFKSWQYAEKENTLKYILSKISIKKIIPQDIEYWLSEFPHIYEMFFKIQSVTDNSLLEAIINDYLKPILKKLDIKTIDSPNYTSRFQEYLGDHFNIYSTAKTLVFGNQQKKLADFYYPLKVVRKPSASSKKENETLVLNEFKSDFIPKYKKVILIDDGGMGKSTVFKWLFLSCIKQNKGIPIYIELRNLSKENDILDEITNKLNPLNFIIERNATAKILSEKGFVFFFDGYDEIKFENREVVTKDLQNFISKCKGSYFAISSRPEKALLAFADFQEFSIQRLERSDAFALIKQMDNHQEKSKRLIEQIERRELNEMQDFLGNPLLVSLLYKKFEYRESIPIKKQEFFYEIFEALFQAHDLSKGGSYIREKESNLSLSEFFQILRGIGFQCIKEGIQFNEVQILEIIDQVTTDFAKNVESYLFLNDLIKAVPLFVRDGLMVRWAHKSIQQYFAAEYICRDSKQNQEKILLALYKSPKVNSYDPILKLCYEIDFKSFRSSIIFSFCKDFIEFFENSFPNLTRAGKIENSELNRRKNLVFQLKIAIIKKKKSQEEIEAEVLEIIEQKWGTKSFVPLYGAPNLCEIIADDSIMDFDIRQLLFSFKNELIDPMSYLDFDEYEGAALPENIPLQPGEPFFLDDDNPSNILNDAQSFKLINEISLPSIGILIDYNKVKHTFINLKIEKDKNNNMDIIAGL